MQFAGQSLLLERGLFFNRSMGPFLILLFIATSSLIAVRVGSIALTITGLSSDAASFQAYSAFFGVGFTTSEAELVVNHPVRRRIIRDLILVGNLGVTSGLATLIVSFMHASDARNSLILLGTIVVGGIVFALMVKIGFVRRLLDFSIRKALERTQLVNALDYETLLNVQDGYCVSEIQVLEGNHFANRKLRESRPSDEGIIILGIQKEDGAFLGAPGPEDQLEVGDVMTIYGAQKAVKAARGTS